MMGRMMGSPAPSAVPADELSMLRALARLLDPEAHSEIERLAASMPRRDVGQAVKGIAELFALITSLTPIEEAVVEAIRDLERREADLAAREARLVKRESAISQALTRLEAL